jgi:hypothetical protein
MSMIKCCNLKPADLDFLQELRTLGPGETISSLQEGLYMPEVAPVLLDGIATFDMATRCLSAGEPVYFKCAEKRWLSFGPSEQVAYGYASKPEDLDEIRQIILDHLRLVTDMLAGLEMAEQRLRVAE